MNVLIISPSVPYPPAFGGAIRVHGIVEGLRRAGHRITLLCFAEDSAPPPELPDDVRLLVAPLPQRGKSARLRDLLTTRQPDIARRLYSATAARMLTELLERERFDMVQFEGIEMAYFQPIVARIQPSARRVLDQHNAEYALQAAIFKIDRRQIKRWPAALYSLMQVGRIKRYESAMCRSASAVVYVSDEDAELLRELCAGTPSAVVSNGIWVDRYAEESASPFTDAQRRQIVFTGKMDYRPNVDAMLWFTESILPRLHDDVHLTIVGQKPHPRLDHLRDWPNVTITGRVPSVLPYLQHATVYIAPLRMGSGTRLKLLEAMACRAPIVATSTAAAGMNAAVREVIQIADGAEAFASAVNALLDDPARRQTMTDSAAGRVAEFYDWSALVPRLLDLYRQIGLEV
ncbi:MAG: glycosyltransferase [Anaerolineaceae bacterium]|nr:MAG: glycosyltransferase [Anaerolineaceae bacterium]